MAVDAGKALDWVCQNETLVKAGLAWAFGLAPVASVAAWFAARYQKLPPWLLRVLQLVALNLAHTAAGEPQKPPAK